MDKLNYHFSNFCDIVSAFLLYSLSISIFRCLAKFYCLFLKKRGHYIFICSNVSTVYILKVFAFWILFRQLSIYQAYCLFAYKDYNCSFIIIINIILRTINLGEFPLAFLVAPSHFYSLFFKASIKIEGAS